MDKLTKLNGVSVDIVCFKGTEPTGYAEIIEVLAQRLAAYEDNNQTPQEQAAMIVDNARLLKERDCAKANSMIQEHIITSGHDPIRDEKIVRLTMENARLRAELDKANKRTEDEWSELASDNTDCVLAYVDGIYSVMDANGSVMCEFMRTEDAATIQPRKGEGER